MFSITIELDESSLTDLNEKADLVGVPVERYIGAVLKQHVESGKVNSIPEAVFRAAVEQTVREKADLYRRLAQ
jgi:hypothetical protein